MKHTNELSQTVAAALEGIRSEIAGLSALQLQQLAPDRAVLVIVDMINGFARGGALFSPRVEALIPGIAELAAACIQADIPCLAFGDAHPSDSPEFTAYPPHCLDGSEESELVSALAAYPEILRIRKNSTNGYLEPVFQQWLEQHSAVDTFIVVGDCTDICIQQFSVALKCAYNRLNRPSRVVVPAALVDTFDLDGHPGDLMHLMALKMMQGSGVELTGGVSYGQ